MEWEHIFTISLIPTLLADYQYNDGNYITLAHDNEEITNVMIWLLNNITICIVSPAADNSFMINSD